MSTTYTDSTGREIVDIEFDRNQDGSRFVLRAVYLDDGSQVPDCELDWLQSEYQLC